MTDLLTSKVDFEMASKLQHLADDVEFLLFENRKRESHKFRNKSYSRRENLVFCGFHVASDDQESCEDKVREIIKDMGTLNVNRIKFMRCHYLNDKKTNHI